MIAARFRDTPYHLTYSFDQLPVAGVFSTGSAEITFTPDGEDWDIVSVWPSHAYDRDLEDVPSPSSEDIRAALLAHRQLDIAESIGELLAYGD